LSLPIGLHLQAEGQRDRLERVLLLFIKVGLKVLEELILGGDLVMMLKMIDHLNKVVR